MLLTMNLLAEFTVFPFEEGEEPPAHVQAALRELGRAGLQVEQGPLSQTVRGEDRIVLEALRSAQAAAIAAGATGMVVKLETTE